MDDIGETDRLQGIGHKFASRSVDRGVDYLEIFLVLDGWGERTKLFTVSIKAVHIFTDNLDQLLFPLN